jgi:hypothetical protein
MGDSIAYHQQGALEEVAPSRQPQANQTDNQCRRILKYNIMLMNI